MRQPGILVGSVVLAALTLPGWGENICAQASVRASVEVGRGELSSLQLSSAELSLADLLTPQTSQACPGLRRAAAQVRLGQTPLPGSPRIFDREQVRQAFAEILFSGILGDENSVLQLDRLQIPERVVVRRASVRTSCDDIAQVLAAAGCGRPLAGGCGFDAAKKSGDEIESESSLSENLDCSAAAHIPQGSRLELMRTRWNPAARSWEFSLRCAQAGECLPFLVRWPEKPAGGLVAAHKDRNEDDDKIKDTAHAASSTSATSSLLSSLTPPHSTEKSDASATPPLVKPGQTVTLVWDQGGLRVVLPVICLDGGKVGESVRARMKNGGHVLRAVVLGAGLLQATL